MNFMYDSPIILRILLNIVFLDDYESVKLLI